MAIENKEINVEGMHCPSCKLAVEMSLKDLKVLKTQWLILKLEKLKWSWILTRFPMQTFLVLLMKQDLKCYN